MANEQHYQAKNSWYGRRTHLIHLILHQFCSIIAYNLIVFDGKNVMYIEDIIVSLAGFGHVVTVTDKFSKFEFQAIASMCDQICNGNALTEKQANLVLQIFNKHVDTIKWLVPEIVEELAQPEWKYPFRSLVVDKSITIESEKQFSQRHVQKLITLRFPFDQQIVDKLRGRNGKVHDYYKGNWNVREKTWTFNLTEKNILFLGNLLLESGFNADEEFCIYYDAIKEAQNNLESNVPILSEVDGSYKIINSHKSIPQPGEVSVTEAAFFAKRYGITIYDDAVSNKLHAEASTVTQKLINSTCTDKLWFNEIDVNVEEFADLIKYGGKTLIIIPGGTELELTRKWTDLALSQGITAEQISVLFRLDSKTETPGPGSEIARTNNTKKDKFHSYIRDMKLNNPITSDTKIVFVSTKITKPLVKSGIHFNTVINLGYYNYLHFTMRVIVDGVCNLLFYSMKAPTETHTWPQHAL